MPNEATINARMPEQLKRRGAQVLDANGVSPTQLIRGLYAYMDREQRIPECLGFGGGKDEEAGNRLKAARSIAGTISLQRPLDVKAARAERIAGKYGELL